MTLSYTFRLITRNWWRNKLFFVISVLSLAIGLACANLLLAFVIYESNIEADNPNRENILYMSQTFPMDITKTISYISGEVPQLIKDKYPEIKDFVRFQRIDNLSFLINKDQMADISLISTDSSFVHFFPYESIQGDINKVFSSPHKIALTEKFAKQVTGDNYPIGQFMRLKSKGDGMTTKKEETDYEIVTILKNRDQSFLSFDAITMNDVSFWGGVTLLLTDQQVDRFSFGERLKKDNIPTLLGNDGQYYFSTLSESYLTDYNNETIPFIKRQQKILLQTSWLAALLILLIACINYVNLNFSRLLEQIKFIKIQRLLGASSFRVGLHLFIDTLCTILIAFLLSLLIIHDLIPVFNSIVSGRLNTAFFLSEQILPLLLLSLVLFAVVVALTMSYRLIKLPIQTSRQQDSFIKKQKTIRVLSIIQNIVSLGLIIATLTVNKQLNLIKKGGDNYKQVYETGSYQSNKEKIKLFAEKIKELPEIESVTTSNSSILFSQIRQLVIKDEQGEENFASILEYKVSPDFNKTLSLGITRGLPPDQAKRTYARPVYVNQAFIDLLVPKDTNPIGQPLVAFDTDFKEQGNTEEASTTNISTIVGILENLHTNSIENHVLPQAFHIDEKAYSYVQYRFNTVSPSVINKVEKIFNEISSDEPFSYNEIFQQYMERNKKVIEFSNLLSMYALISLFLTAFGLFGTAYYTTIRRTKEIGIRQINGATNTQIFILLNKRFIKWIGIAIVLTIPPMWIILQSWLQHFAYRITITPDIFIVSGLIVSVITLLTVGWHSYRITARSPVKSLKSE